MRLATNHDNAPVLLVYALEQEKGEQPVTEIITRKGSVKPITGPALLTKILRAGIENENSNWRDLTGCDSGLSRDDISIWQ